MHQIPIQTKGAIFSVHPFAICQGCQGGSLPQRCVRMSNGTLGTRKVRFGERRYEC
jgi:hypothetical protein